MEKVLNIVIPTGASTSAIVEVRDFTYTATRMGKAPTISAQFKHQTFFQNWYSTPYVTFNNRTFYMKGTPSSSYSNEEIVYKYDATFVADDSLERTYFIDAVQDNDPSYCSNNSKVQFWGDLSDFAARLNAVLGKVGLSDKYWVYIDSGTVTSANYPKAFEDKLISFEDKYIYDVLTDDCYNAFDVPFFLDGAYSNYNSRPSGFTGTVVCFSEKNGEISTPFEYGVNKSLLSINRENANAEIITRCSGYGSSENLPWYYPNETSTGTHTVYATGTTATGQSGLGSPIKFINYETLATHCDLFNDITLNVHQSVQNESGIDFNDYETTVVYKSARDGTVYGSVTEHKQVVVTTWSKYLAGCLFELEFEFYAPGGQAISINVGQSVLNDVGDTYETEEIYADTRVEYEGMPTSFISPQAEEEWRNSWSFKWVIGEGNNRVPFCYILTTPSGDPKRYHLYVNCSSYRKNNRGSGIQPTNVTSSFSIEVANSIEEPYFTIDNDTEQEDGKWRVDIAKSGVSFENVAALHTGDYIRISYENDWVQPQPNLMPKIFRGRKYPSPYWDVAAWTERFYNALNNTYPLPDATTPYSASDYYSFSSPYTANNKHEHIESFDDIKPTIKGMMNGIGQRIDMFAAIAFDTNDYDQFTYTDNNEKEYVHPYFYVKLREFSGTNGFNLFDQAIDSDTMKINMTSGICGGCAFEVMVDPDTKQNPVAVDNGGALIRDENGDVKIWKSKADAQAVQNDTSSNEVWIALKKDIDTYGTIMPSLKDNYGITTSDTFVITGINLPKAYIFSAEKRLEDAIIKYMYDNNSEKFKFSIDFSRIYFEEDEGAAVLPQLKEGAKISVKYPLEAENAITTYVTGITYQMSKDSHLPKVSVDLADEIVIPKSFAKQISRTISNAIAEQEESQARKAKTKTPVQQEGGGSNGMSLELILALINSSAKDQYIGMTKTQEEAALQPLEGIESIEIGEDGEFGIDENGDATLHDAEFTGDIQTDNFQDVAGQIVGAQITHAGKITASAIKALSFEIFELIYNRIRTTGGRQSFTSAAGTVDKVTLVDNSNGIYRLDMHSDEDRADGDKTEFQVGDIFYSYVNHVNNRGYSQGGQCWMHVTEVNTSGTNNYILAQMYGSPDTTADVSGVHTRYNNAYSYNNTTHYLPSAYNLVPEDGMVITHWGNISNTGRQTTFYVDCEDGNILQLMGVDEPQISYTNGNYGSIVGKLPQQLIDAVRTKTGYVLNPNQPYIYARGLVAQDFIQLDYQGKIIRTENNRGEWSYATASGDSPYMSTATYYDAVSYNGCLYMCVQSGTTSEPGIDGTWMLINGAGLKVYGLLVDPNAINIKTNGTITPSTTISAKVKKLVANKPMELLSLQSEIEDEGLRVEYSFDGSVWAEFTIGVNGVLSTEGGLHIVTEDQDPSPIVLEGGGLDISSLPSDARLSVRLVRESDDEVIDTLDIPVTKDGEKGDEGTTFSVKGEAYVDPNSTHTWAVGEFKYNPSATPSSAITICTATGTPPTWTSVAVAEGDAYILRDTASAGHMIYYNGTIWVDLGNITGRGISSITINYAVNNDSANAPTSGWSPTRGGIDETNPFLWQRVKTNYTDGSSSDWSAPVLIGSYGRDAYSLDVSMPVIPVMVEATSTANVYKVLSSISGNVNIKLMKGGTQQSITSSNVSVTPDITMSGSYNYFTISVVSNVLIIHYSLSANSTYLIPNTFTATITVNGVSLSTSVAVAKSQRGTVGPMGDTGPLMYPAGVYDETTAKCGYSDANGYINDGVSTPYVYYIAPDAEEGNYYYRTQKPYHDANGEISAAALSTRTPYTPAEEDSLVSASERAWKVITKYESVWAKILFANFGRLSEFVFWGKWMFSVWGKYTNPLTAEETQAEYAVYLDEIEEALTDDAPYVGDFKNCAWVPNFYANSDTGEVHMGDATVEGLITERFDAITDDYNPQVVLFDGETSHHTSFEYHDSPKALLLPMRKNISGIVTSSNGSQVQTSSLSAFDGAGVSVRVVNQAVSWVSSNQSQQNCADEGVLLCADPRMFVPDNYVVDNNEVKYAPGGTAQGGGINMDYDGYFIWNGIYAKFILLPPGYMVRLTSLDNYDPTANDGDGTNYRYWFVEGAFDLASVGMKVKVVATNAYTYQHTTQSKTPGPHHAEYDYAFLAPSWLTSAMGSDPTITIDLVNGGTIGASNF